MKPVLHAWRQRDLIGGHPAIDFANTFSGWGEANEDWLVDYARFAQWARLAGFIDEAELKKTIAAAARHPPAAERVFAEANELRFAFLRLLHAVKGGGAAKAGDLAVVNRWIRRAAELVELRQAGQAFREDWAGQLSVLEKPLLVAARAVGRFLVEGDFGRLKICPGQNCRWFFVDLSKNHSRRWCDMAVCGNLAKARRFHHRQRREATAH
jgi:predicted RNA-binding Zn ribbon-like protein